MSNQIVMRHTVFASYKHLSLLPQACLILNHTYMPGLMADTDRCFAEFQKDASMSS